MTSVLALGLTLCAATPATNVRQVLWREPKPMTAEDWTWGSGGNTGAPGPPFRFERENLAGTNPKVDVRDATGRLWMVKFGGEVHAETFASRILYATGYFTQSTYYVPSGVILGAHGLTRARAYIAPDGRFRKARFRLHDERLVYLRSTHWSWDDNPFVGTHELAGLKILLMLASNWDAKDGRDGDGANTAVFRDRVTGDLIYAFDDWGDAFGKSGGFMRRTRWDAAGYSKDTPAFVSLWPGGYIAWGFEGKHGRDIRSGVTIEDVRWLLKYLSAVTSGQFNAGLAASGASQREAELFAREMAARIDALKQIAAETRIPVAMAAGAGDPFSDALHVSGPGRRPAHSPFRRSR